MDWFSLWLEFFSIVAQACLHLFFSGYFTGKQLKLWHFLAYFILLFADDAVSLILNFPMAGVWIELLVLYGINRIALKNQAPAACVSSVLAIYVVQLSFGVFNSLYSFIIPGLLGRQLLVYMMIIIAALSEFLLCFFCYRAIIKWFSVADGACEPYLWILLPPAFFFFAAQLYITSATYGYVVSGSIPTGDKNHLILLMLQLLGLGALSSALYAYRHIRAGFQAQAALASLRQETHAQKTYVMEAQMRYEQTKAFRHDIKNHLSVVDGLLKCGSPGQAKDYLQKLIAATEALSFPVHTGNPVVDILLGGKLELAKADGIETELSLVLPSPCAVDDLDLCIIFANALDNSIHACAKVKESKEISITGISQGDFYMLEIENTCSAGPLPPMGTGLENVKAVADKYGGAMTIEKNSSRFCLNVLLNISRQPGDIS